MTFSTETLLATYNDVAKQDAGMGFNPERTMEELAAFMETLDQYFDHETLSDEDAEHIFDVCDLFCDSLWNMTKTDAMDDPVSFARHYEPALLEESPNGAAVIDCAYEKHEERVKEIAERMDMDKEVSGITEIGLG